MLLFSAVQQAAFGVVTLAEGMDGHLVNNESNATGGRLNGKGDRIEIRTLQKSFVGEITTARCWLER